MILRSGSLVLAGLTGVLSTRVASDKSYGVGYSAENTEPYLGDGNDTALLESGSNGRIIIKENCKDQVYYLPGADVIQGGRTVRLWPGKRYYLMKEPTTNYRDASKFKKVDMVSQQISFDVNFGPGGASCGCNVFLQWVDMPAASPGKDGDYYCDAQCKPGQGCCAEWDMFKGNNKAFAIQNHACTGGYRGHSDWKCHKWGNPATKSTPQQFNPGYEHWINTKRWFTVQQLFEYQWETEMKVTTELLQDGKTKWRAKMNPNDQMNAMKKTMNGGGLALVIGYNSQNTEWLDRASCGEGPKSCNNRPVLISNLVLVRAGLLNGPNGEAVC